MRFKKTALVGLCLFSGAIYTSTMQPSIVTAMLVAQDADPLGNSSASKPLNKKRRNRQPAKNSPAEESFVPHRLRRECLTRRVNGSKNRSR